MPNDLASSMPKDAAGSQFAAPVDTATGNPVAWRAGTVTRAAITGSPTSLNAAGGMVEAPDGALVTIGTQADTAYTGSGSATSIAILKGLYAAIKSLLTTKIVDSGGTNQLAVDVAGKIGVNNFPATQPVSAASLPLPTGAAQESGNLASVATNTSNTATNTSNINTTTGATADAAVTGDNAGSISAKLRGLSKMLADVWDSVNHRLHVNVDAGTVTANAGTNLNTSALALETGGNLAAAKTDLDNIVTNTAHNNPAGSNTGFTSLPANTNAAADTALTFTSAVNHWTLQNASNQTIYYALDASTTVANTPIYTLTPGSQVWWDWPVTVVHVYTATAIPVNGAIGSLGLTLIGRA